MCRDVAGQQSGQMPCDLGLTFCEQVTGTKMCTCSTNIQRQSWAWDPAAQLSAKPTSLQLCQAAWTRVWGMNYIGWRGHDGRELTERPRANSGFPCLLPEDVTGPKACSRMKLTDAV